MSDSEINDEDDIIDQEDENANEALDEEEVGSQIDEEEEGEGEEEKVIKHEEVPQIVIERV